jgi:hypothetical protein
VTTNERRLVVDIFPALARELQEFLAAAQVPDLAVVERCRCGDDFCGMFYVLPKPNGAYGPGHRNVALTPEEGMLILDVVADKIAAIEVL